MLRAKELSRQNLIYNAYLNIIQLHNSGKPDKEIFEEICNCIRHVKESERSCITMNPKYDQHVAMDDIVSNFKNLITNYNVTENNIPSDLKDIYLDIIWDNSSTLSIIYSNKYEILSQSRYRYIYIKRFKPNMEYMAIPNITADYTWNIKSGLYTKSRESYYHQRRLDGEETYEHEYKIFYENRDIFITESVDKYYAI